MGSGGTGRGAELHPVEVPYEVPSPLRVRHGSAAPCPASRRHDLRHTYGSHLAMRGVALKVIQELMGHATIEMTMRYAHLSPEARESAVQELDRPIPQPRAALG